MIKQGQSLSEIKEPKDNFRFVLFKGASTNGHVACLKHCSRGEIISNEVTLTPLSTDSKAWSLCMSPSQYRKE